MQYLSFMTIISFSVVSTRIIHIITNGTISFFFFLRLKRIPSYLYTADSSFIHPLNLSCFHEEDLKIVKSTVFPIVHQQIPKSSLAFAFKFAKCLGKWKWK